jgi:hypothetical protein
VRRFACAVLFATLGATACGVEQSSLDANAQVTITGKALAADGRPLANAKVALIRELDMGQAIGGLFVTAVTLGIACLADHPPALCANNSHTAPTRTDGTYSFSVRGADTQGSVGIASTMEVLVRVAPGNGQAAGALALAEFKVQTSNVQVPDLRIWNPPVDLSTDRRSARLIRPTLPASGYGTGAKYWLEFDNAKGRVAWVVGSLGADAAVDSRILEDLRGTAFVGARTTSSAGGLAVAFTFVSGAIGFEGLAGPAPSRGASCAAVTAGASDAFKTPCSLTSGDFGGAYTSGAAPTGVLIDLGEVRSIYLVVVRGCSGQCSIAAGADPSALRDAGSISGEYGALTVSPARSVRYVRVTGSQGVSLMRQISVW